MIRATVTKGSGNVFRDLGLSEEKSAELILKRALLLGEWVNGTCKTAPRRVWASVSALCRGSRNLACFREIGRAHV